VIVSREVAVTPPPSRPPRSWNGEGEVLEVVPLLRAEKNKTKVEKHALPGMRKLLLSPPQCSLCWRSLPCYMPTLLPPSGVLHPPGVFTLRGSQPPSGDFYRLRGFSPSGDPLPFLSASPSRALRGCGRGPFQLGGCGPGGRADAGVSG